MFVIVAERMLRLVSLSESLESRSLPSWRTGGRSHTAFRGASAARLGQRRTESRPCLKGGVGSSRKTKWTLGQNFLCPLVVLTDDTAGSGSQSLGHRSSPGPSVPAPCVVQPWRGTQIPPTRSTPDLLHLDPQLESAGPRPSCVSSVWP